MDGYNPKLVEIKSERVSILRRKFPWFWISFFATLFAMLFLTTKDAAEGMQKRERERFERERER